jgi:hypothetical protein
VLTSHTGHPSKPFSAGGRGAAHDRRQGVTLDERMLGDLGLGRNAVRNELQVPEPTSEPKEHSLPAIGRKVRLKVRLKVLFTGPSG